MTRPLERNLTVYGTGAAQARPITYLQRRRSGAGVAAIAQRGPFPVGSRVIENQISTVGFRARFPVHK
jgi:hypothetical protein